jgi:uncharacterized membrane protein YeiB
MQAISPQLRIQSPLDDQVDVPSVPRAPELQDSALHNSALHNSGPHDSGPYDSGPHDSGTHDSGVSQELPSTSSTPVEKKERMLGIDVARALAMLGMLYAHFGARAKDSKSAAAHVVKFVDGRAMPMFMLLGGLGADMLLRRSKRPIRQMAARGAVLLPLGLYFSYNEHGPAVILQYYALFFVLAALIRKASNRTLLFGAAGVLSVSTILRFTVIKRFSVPFRVLDNAPDIGALSYVKRPDMLLLELTLRGFYPLFPSFAFFLFGMWLARQNLSSGRVQSVMFGGGLAVAAVLYPLGWATQSHRTISKAEMAEIGPLAEGAVNAAGFGFTLREAVTFQGVQTGKDFEGYVAQIAKREGAPADAIRQMVDEIDANPAMKKLRTPNAWSLLNVRAHSQMPAWILASGAFAVALLGACLAFAARWRRLARPLALAGQLSLTMYVGHLMLMRWPMKNWPWGFSATEIVLLTTVGFAGFALFATLWRRKLSVGPFEAVVRFAGNLGEGKRTGSLKG